MPGPFPIGQVSFKSYLPGKNLLVLDYLTGLFFKAWVSLEGNCWVVLVGQWSTNLVLLAKLLIIIKVIQPFEYQPALSLARSKELWVVCGSKRRAKKKKEEHV